MSACGSSRVRPWATGDTAAAGTTQFNMNAQGNVGEGSLCLASERARRSHITQPTRSRRATRPALGDRSRMPWNTQGGGPWGSGGGKGPWGSGQQPSSGPNPPDLEEILRRGQDRLRRFLPGGQLGGRGFALIALGVVALWGFSGFFKVEPDELGVVLRFGKEVREVKPGLNYHLPYPIESVLTPKALRVNKIDIGMRVGAGLRRGG